MKNITFALLFVFSISANAFWGNGWSNGWGNQDNGIFGFNPYEMWEPRWYSEEMDNFINEFDNDNNYGNPYGNYGNYGNRNPYSGNRNNYGWGRGFRQNPYGYRYGR